jgi:hypothetical protein
MSTCCLNLCHVDSTVSLWGSEHHCRVHRGKAFPTHGAELGVAQR